MIVMCYNLSQLQDIYTDCAFIRLNVVIRSLVRAKERLPHCFQPVGRPFFSNSSYREILSWASLTWARLGLKAPTNPDVCHVVPPPSLTVRWKRILTSFIVISCEICIKDMYLPLSTKMVSGPNPIRDKWYATAPPITPPPHMTTRASLGSAYSGSSEITSVDFKTTPAVFRLLEKIPLLCTAYLL